MCNQKEETMSDKVEQERCCPAKDYEEIYTKGVDCFYCSVPMKDCEYWQNRAKDKEINRDDYRCYLLGRLK